ncbi:MAG: hypothetical protein INR72_19365 [Williamsia herbipolensis]|nr:hypothetical protein [Williamsia herbipolensis]
MTDQLERRLHDHYADLDVDPAIEDRLSDFARDLQDRPDHRLRNVASIAAAAAVVAGLAVGIPLATSSGGGTPSVSHPTGPSPSVVHSPSPAAGHVPPAFRPACGHPGTHVVIHTHHVTVRHAACDLTGVVVSYRNVRKHYSVPGARVPGHPGGVGNSGGFTVTVAKDTLDVTITVAHGRPGNG